MKKIKSWKTMSISGAMLNSGSLSTSASRTRMDDSCRYRQALVDLRVERLRPTREALDLALQVVVDDHRRDRDRQSAGGGDERLVDAVREQLGLAETLLHRDRREGDDQTPHRAEQPEQRRDDVDD